MPTAGYNKKPTVASKPAIVAKFMRNLLFAKYPIINETTATEQMCIGKIIFIMFCQEKSVHIDKFTTLDAISKNSKTETNTVSKIFFAF